MASLLYFQTQRAPSRNKLPPRRAAPVLCAAPGLGTLVSNQTRAEAGTERPGTARGQQGFPEGPSPSLLSTPASPRGVCPSPTTLASCGDSRAVASTSCPRLATPSWQTLVNLLGDNSVQKPKKFSTKLRPSLKTQGTRGPSSHC